MRNCLHSRTGRGNISSFGGILPFITHRQDKEVNSRHEERVERVFHYEGKQQTVHLCSREAAKQLGIIYRTINLRQSSYLHKAMENVPYLEML